MSGGAFATVADDAALNDLFARLGTRLGAGLEVLIAVPPLSPGKHRLEIRARVDGEPVASTSMVPVTNDGLLDARVRGARAAASEALVLELTTVAPPETLDVRAEARGVPLPVLDQPLRVLIDPWRFAPGRLEVGVIATMGETLVSSATFATDVPPLQPELRLDLRPGPSGSAAVVTGRIQGPAPGTLVARVDGREVARGPAPELGVSGIRGERLEAAIEDASGRTLATAAQALAPAATGGEGAATARWSLAAAALAALVGLPVGTKRWAGRRASRRRRWEPSARTMLVGRGGAARASDHEALGTLAVRTPHGTERRYPVTRRPLSIGRGAECDVVIEDPAVGSVHARLRALGDGEFQVHGIAPRRDLPFTGRRQDEWMVVRQGEQIAIGTHVLTLLPAGDRAQPVEAAHG